MNSNEAGVARIHQNRQVPDMTAFELALISAISRNPLHKGDEGIVAQLSYWFMQPVRIPDARLAMEQLIGKGLLTASETGAIYDCMRTEAGLDCATTLYGGMHPHARSRPGAFEREVAQQPLRWTGR